MNPGLNEIVKKNYLSNRLKFTSDLSKAVNFPISSLFVLAHQHQKINQQI